VLEPDFPIKTARLLIRPLEPGDRDALHAYQSLPEVCRYVPYEPRTPEQIAERLADPERTRASLMEPGQAMDLAVIRRDTGQLIGDVLLFWHSAEHRSGEVGYALHPAHHGHGFATEAAAAMLELGFEGLRLHRITGRIDARNEPSAAVLRRLGMRQEAVLVENEWFKGEWSTEIDFAILEHEWRALRKAHRPTGR
jgi:RimJ/RimL family protein N-acetyltransferase